MLSQSKRQFVQRQRRSLQLKHTDVPETADDGAGYEHFNGASVPLGESRKSACCEAEAGTDICLRSRPRRGELSFKSGVLFFDATVTRAMRAS